MKKSVVLVAAFMAMGISTAFGAVTLRYHNADSKSHTYKVKIDGSTKEVTFDASKTGDVTIQGGAKECVIICDCGEVKVHDGEKVEIKNGCVKED